MFLVNQREFIELVTPYDKVNPLCLTSTKQFNFYGLLLATFKTVNGVAVCFIHGFHLFQSIDGQPVLNQYDCPILELSKMVFCTSSTNISRSVSLVHECTDSCGFKNIGQSWTLERESTERCALVYFHVWNNAMFFNNVYLVH